MAGILINRKRKTSTTSQDDRVPQNWKNFDGAEGPREPDFDLISSGYYVSQQKEELHRYIVEMLRKYHTVTLSCHVGANFKSTVRSGEEYFCYSAVSRHLVDIDILEKIPKMMLFNSVEDIEGFYKSGLAQDSQPYYFMKINDVKLIHGLNNKHVSVEGSAEEAIAKAKCRGMKSSRERNLKFKKCLLEIKELSRGYVLTPSNIHQWNIKENIRIFNTRGYAVYAHMVNTAEPWIDLLWNSTNGKFSNFIYTRAVFKMKGPGMCGLCHTFHKKACRLGEVDIRMPKWSGLFTKPKPEEDIDNVVYANFECYKTKNGIYIPSGVCFYFLQQGEVFQDKILTHLKCTKDFIDRLEIISSRLFTPTRFDDPSISCDFCNSFLRECRFIRDPKTGLDYSSCLTCCKSPRLTLHVIFHNFKGFASHLVIREIARRKYQKIYFSGKSIEKLDVIHVTKNYIHLKFMDSYNFLSATLKDLGEQLINRKLTTGNEFMAPFPYDWFDSPAKLEEKIPSEDQWYNTFSSEKDDWIKTKEIWYREKMTSFKNYHDYCLDLNVRLLADVMEEFRNTVKSADSVDPLYFQGAPGLSWYLGTKDVNGSIGVIPSISVYVDIQKNIRGGVAQVTRKYADKQDGEILYLDFNSLYSWCMTKSLPTFYRSTLTDLPEDWMTNEFDYIVSCDLEYPKELHDLHYEFPLAPEKYELTTKQSKLFCTLFPKKKYLVYGETLKFYIEHGLHLTTVHYCYEFVRAPVLRDYVTRNIETRQANLNKKQLADFQKLKNNSLYGKTCENVFKYNTFCLLYNNVTDDVNDINHDPKAQPKDLNLVNLADFMELDEGVFLGKQAQKSVTINKPIQLGFAVLEWAKIRIYEFWYTMKGIYKNDVKFLYTDTDSLILQFSKRIPDPWADFKQHAKLSCWIDFSKSKEMGLMADEAKGRIISEYIGIRAKCYAISFVPLPGEMEGENEVLKNKGVAAAAQVRGDDNQLRKVTFKLYSKCLFEHEDLEVEQRVIQSKRQRVAMRLQRRTALSDTDDKRFTCSDGVSTVAWGYQGLDHESPHGSIFDTDNRIYRLDDGT